MKNCFRTSAFLIDVKSCIKDYFGSQERFARELGYSRKLLNRILNSEDEITIGMINIICS